MIIILQNVFLKEKMKIMDKYFKEDIDYLVKKCTYLNDIHDKTILVTGATGLVGSTLIKTLLEYNRHMNINLKIIALGRNEEKMLTTFENYLQDESLKIFICDINSKIEILDDINYIVHTAAVTKSMILKDFPVETALTSILGTKNILELAKEKQVYSMVYLSSMEVYGTFGKSQIVNEEMLGYIDLKNVRNGYPESKRICEFLCNAYFKEYGVKVKSARLAQTFGAGVPLDDTRIFSTIARSVIQSKDIVLHTKGLSEANYCYISDTINGILTILIKGINGEVYNISNESCHTTICNMAEMVCEKIAEGKIKVVFDIPEDVSSNGYAPDTKMKLSSEKLRKLGWKPQYNLEDSYKRLILSYKERMK